MSSRSRTPLCLPCSPALQRALCLAGLLALSCAQPHSGASLQPGSSQERGSAAAQPPGTQGVSEAPLVPLRALRIASWNLQWLHRNDGSGPVPRRAEDYARLQGYAERLAADVVAVQEVDGVEAVQRVFDTGRYELQLAQQRGHQLAGFAIRRGLEVTRHPDVLALNTTGDLRNGVDVSVRVNGFSLRLLGVHLKSGCFDAPLHGAQPSCRKLKAQLPKLEQWIDARAAEGEAFVVLGDFNRQLRSGEAFYAELDDGQPPNADLTLVSDGHQSRCWGGEYPNLIDHIAVSRNAAPWVLSGSFAQQLFDATEAPHRKRLSDHCAISVLLRPGDAGLALPPSAQPPSAQPPPPQPPAGQPPSAPVRPIKGNVSSRGRRLYHAPGCPQYERVQVDESKGERLFASEAEAVAAGWQKAPNCP